ncbi:MAG: thioredoxin family protein [Clostridium sp.]|nr:thioredoxin family protein [Clostridium sp.]MCM1443898.1 thioredoxin family protein [Candidatus Amulumruptor caecigallinarius]
MNEKKKGIILLIIVGIIVVLILVGVICNIMEQKKVFDKFNEYYNGSQATLVVLRKDGCVYCEAYEPEIEFMSKYYGFSYEELSIDKLSTSDYSKMLEMLGITDTSKFGTPYTVILQNKSVVATLAGAQEEEQIFKFLKDNNFVKQDDKLLIDYVDYNGYVSALNSKDKTVIALAQTSCIHCKNVKPVLNELIRDYNIDIKVLNVDLLAEEDYNKLNESLEFFKTVQWGTPTFLIVQDGKLLDYISGEQTKDTFVNKFKQLQLIGE